MNQATKARLECIPSGNVRDIALALFDVVDAQDAFEALTQEEQENTLKPHDAYARLKYARARLAEVEKQFSGDGG